MPKFSKHSLARLYQCDERIQCVFLEVIKYYDCSILEGHRDEELQNEYYRKGLTKLKYPESTHNKIPSLGIDAAPYPIDWEAIKRFYHFGGFVKGVAESMNIKLRWGGDWDDDTDISDQTFMDLVHFELKEKK